MQTGKIVMSKQMCWVSRRRLHCNAGVPYHGDFRIVGETAIWPSALIGIAPCPTDDFRVGRHGLIFDEGRRFNSKGQTSVLNSPNLVTLVNQNAIWQKIQAQPLPPTVLRFHARGLSRN